MSFLSKIRSRGKLVFVPGNHTWAGEQTYTLGMAYLYANNLNAMRMTSKDYDLYIKDFCSEMKEMIDAETDQFRKYELLTVLATVMRNKEINQVRKELNTVKFQKEVRLYIDAQKDLEKFLKKYYRSEYSKKGPINSRGVKDMEKLLKKYKDLPFADIMKRLAEKAP